MDLMLGMSIINTITKNTIKQALLFKHNKTGNTYILLNDSLIECTNGREEKMYCLYANTEGKIFRSMQPAFVFELFPFM